METEKCISRDLSRTHPSSPEELKFRNLVAKDQQGVVLILLTILIPSIALLLSLTLNTGYSTIIRSELQAAADAAALSGAQNFNGNQNGWIAAREAAVSALIEHQVHGALGDSPVINIAATDLEPLSGGGDSAVLRTVWNLDNLTISIRRGRWNPSTNTFTSMEDTLADDDSTSTWQQQPGNAGIPRLLAANAVEVAIERPDVTVLVPFGADRSFAARVVSVASAGFSDDVCIAPFALPACSVLNANGELPEPFGSAGIQSPICEGDRLFSKINGHTDINGNSIVPQFPYDGRWCPGGDCVTPVAASCRWGGNRLLPLNTKHYGVVGLPEHPGPTEDEVRAVIESPTGCVTARLGQRFNILPAGLTNPLSDAAVWEQISGADPANPDAAHPALSNTDINQSIDRSINWSPGPALFCPSRSYKTFGICNSKRKAATAGAGCPVQYQNNPPSLAALEDNFPVWNVRIPVIANVDPSNVGACASTIAPSNPPTDPTLDPDQPYEIIGFVPAFLYDNDIGAAPPTNPGAGCNNMPGGSWGFWNGATPQSCNLVRGRVNCNTTFVAADENMAGTRTPLLVEAPPRA